LQPPFNITGAILDRLAKIHRSDRAGGQLRSTQTATTPQEVQPGPHRRRQKVDFPSGDVQVGPATRRSGLLSIVPDPTGDFVEGFATAVALAAEAFEQIGLAGLFAGADAVAAEDVDRTGG
jgi:hypothetical protein